MESGNAIGHWFRQLDGGRTVPIRGVDLSHGPVSGFGAATALRWNWPGQAGQGYIFLKIGVRDSRRKGAPVMLRVGKGLLRRWAQSVFIAQFRWMSGHGWLPLNRNFGRDRGLPVGRWYLEEFLSAHANRVRGRCLEFGDLRYRNHFLNAEKYEVLSLVPGPEVDFLGDIHEPPKELEGCFDWIICTQVFQCLRRPDIAAKQLHRLLKPAGSLLFSVPFINIVHPDPEDFRRFTADGVRVTLEDAGFVIENLSARGNFLTSVGALIGLSSSDFPPESWKMDDRQFPYIITAHATKPANGDEN